MSDGKRTRSQLTLPDFFNRLQLQRSPLKEARSAVRNIDTIMDPQAHDSEDPKVQTPKKKRSSSPSLSDSALSVDRESKRSKKSAEADVENDKAGTPRLEAGNMSGWRKEVFESLKKQAPSTSSQYTGVSWDQTSPGRARSVPPLESGRSTPVPHLDLRAVPPSPWRSSPSKGHVRLRMMSVPPPSPSPEYALDNDKTPRQFTKADRAKLTPKEGIQGTTPRALCINPFDFDKIPMLAKTPAHGNTITFMTPLSPLTPLPSTPSHTPGPSKLSSNPLPSAFEVCGSGQAASISRSSSVASTSSLTSGLKRMPSLIFSRLPRPSESISKPEAASSSSTTIVDNTQPIASSSRTPPPALIELEPTNTVEQPSTTIEIASASQVVLPDPITTTKPPSSGATRTKTAKLSKRPTPMPLGGRMTRSVALRMKERQKKEESSTSSAALKSRKSMTFSKAPGPSTATSSIATKSRPSTPVKPATRSETPSRGQPLKTGPIPSPSSLTTPSASSGATPRSRKKSIPLPGDLQRLLPFSTPSEKDRAIPSTSSSQESTTRPASLSNLSNALEKLSQPPPSRPNTVMGFNPVINSEESGGLGKGKGKASPVTGTKDDGGVGRKSTGAAKQPASLKRSSTITSFFSAVGSSSSSSVLSTPAPATRSSTLKAQTSGNTMKRPSSMFVIPTAGSTVGSMKNRGGNMAIRLFGKGGGGVVGTKVFDRVSKRSSLPSVEGTPVKGSYAQKSREVSVDTEDTCAGASHPVVNLQEKTQEDIIDLLDPANASDVSNEPSGSGNVDSEGKGKERRIDAWKNNASRRASLASQALSQSLSSLPQTPPRTIKGSMGPPPVPRYPGLRSASSSYPSSSSSGFKKTETAPGAIERGTESHASSGKSEINGSGKKAGRSALKVLKECVIFVDVRTDDGDDAGSLFVDMLKGLGARILSRVGQTCTHFVYKNGSTSTLTRYRLLDDPKPFVVGIAWVVECAEQRDKVDETKFLVDLDGVNVAGTIKRRRSMLPKQVPIVPRDSPIDIRSTPDGSRSFDGSVDGDSGNRPVEKSPSNDGEDDLPPLEKARRRRSMLLKS